jgi:hypothetical protein
MNRIRLKIKAISQRYNMLPTSQNAKATKSPMSGEPVASRGANRQASTLIA